MSDSHKLDNTKVGSYSLDEKSKYTFTLLEELSVNKNVTFVLNDWGSAVGFHWATTYRLAVKGIAFMKAIITPLATWDNFPKELHALIETLSPANISHSLRDKEHSEHHKLFLNTGENNLTILACPRQLPTTDQPTDTSFLVGGYTSYLVNSTTLPKLFIIANPGAFLVGYACDFVRTWLNLTEITVSGSHNIQEDCPHEIGKATLHWLPA